MELKTYVNDERYEVTKCGRVFLKEQTIIRKNGIPMPIKRKEKARNIKDFGYEYVTISKNGKSRIKNVHRIVAETWIPNTENKPFVNHIDGNKLNNHVDNLEWVNKQENQRHAEDNNMILGRAGGRTVRVYDKSGWIGTFKSLTKAAKALNLNRIIIGRVLNTDNEYKGYKFKSVETRPRS